MVPLGASPVLLNDTYERSRRLVISSTQASTELLHLASSGFTSIKEQYGSSSLASEDRPVPGPTSSTILRQGRYFAAVLFKENLKLLDHFNIVFLAREFGAPV